MAERTWTKPQSDAITARGGSVLVSAAAGSGKTAVLVERAVRLICDPVEPVDADRLLVVTFSRAAAAEMKQRMGMRLTELIRENPEDIRLQRQQALLAGAQISTVDSFCLDLVRQNFQNLEVSPDFSIADQNELTIMENDCVADCIAWFYENEGEGAFPELVELLSTARNDDKLAEVILRIYGFSRSHPFFEEWLDEKLGMYGTDQPVAETVWGRSIFAHVRESLGYCRELVRGALDIVVCDEKMEKAYGPALQSDLSQIGRCLELAEEGHWDGTVEALGGFIFERLGSLRGDDPDKVRAKSARDRSKKIVQELAQKYMNATAAEFRDDLEDLRPKIEMLFRMVKDFSDRLDAAKAEKKRLHFSDLEHLALKLLVEKSPDGYRPTTHAAEIAEKYNYVLVDEYQDTNEVQDLIFTCVSRQQRNLFMVGDVKQSIYGFRQAMPEIFMAKKEKFFPYEKSGQYPAKIMLDTNFRSRGQVTGAVNAIFGMIMSAEMGDVEYDEAESLKCGAIYTDYDARPELLLIGTKAYKGARASAASVDTTALEAREIGRKIRDMLRTGYRVEERGELRPAALRDFCILMRSPRGRAETYVKELGLLGIAAIAENAGGYLSAREVSAVVSLLRALDNPLLDIDLVAAMLSPLFDFDADDIARIRLIARGRPFYTALRRAAEADDGDEFTARCKVFLAVFARLRTEAAVLPADRLIMRIYDETDALAVFQAMGMGEERKANLLLLIEYAADYHRMGYKQLGGFVGFLGRLADREGDLAPAVTLGDGANAVRIMSIHRSKGLEFPVVFLSDTARQFNKVDLRQNTLLHSKYGFACVRRDHETLKQFPTIPMQAIRLEAQRSILSEELRILYVALTRAREKLIITGVVKTDLQKRLSGLCYPLQENRLSSYVVGEGNCYADWVLMALLHHPSCQELREAAHVAELELVDDGNPWAAAVTELSGDEEEQPEEAAAPAVVAEADPRLLEQLRERASWSYPHAHETKVPTKLSVSAVAKGEQNIQYRFKSRPKFLTEAKLTPTERGNAMHKFMQFASYEAARDDLEAEIERMGRQQYLSGAEAEGIQVEKLRCFFASQLAGRIFSSKEVHRELKFMAECGQDMLDMENLGDSKIVVQGVADCVFIEDGEAVIVDYKTDRVKTAEELRERYTVQLNLYRRILTGSLGVPVKECILYSFHLSEAIHVAG